MSGGKRKGGAIEPHPTPPDADSLRRMYWDEGRSLESLAHHFGVSIASIRKRMIRYGIPRRKACQPFTRDTTIIPHPTEPGVSMVPLGNGLYAMIDEEDECRVDQNTWTVSRAPLSSGGELRYAHTTIYQPKKQTLIMHRLLFGLTGVDRVFVDHKDHDGLNNRRKNLRLATPKENVANSRKYNKKTSSSYTGVHRDADRNIWRSAIATNGKRFRLGDWATEGEAAIAYQAAARMLNPSEFLHVEEIAESDRLTPDRTREIESSVRLRVNAFIEGRKTSPRATSNSIGVGWIGNRGKWKAAIHYDGKCRSFGFFSSEIEAAYAYDRAAHHLKMTDRKLNGIEPHELPDAATVEAQVLAKIAAFRDGRKGKLDCCSQFKGAFRERRSGRWAGFIKRDGRTTSFGLMNSEPEAAYAANVAAEYLGRPIPNTIPEADLPSPERMAEIRDLVRRKLAPAPA